MSYESINFASNRPYMKAIVIASGYFNPVHAGHLEYLENSKKLGDELIVIINNDLQVQLKGSKPFQNQNERTKIIASLKMVNHVFLSIDKDRSVIESIKKIVESYPSNGFKFLFCNGGDQFNSGIAEKEICDKLGVKLVDNLGDKIQSSSTLKRTKRLIVDIDNTLTIDQSEEDYPNKTPRINVINKLKEYQEQGFEIILFTARNMKTYQNDVSRINKYTIPILKEWLERHGVSYDGLIVGKPWCGEDGFYIDDRAIRPSEFIKYSPNQIKNLIEQE